MFKIGKLSARDHEHLRQFQSTPIKASEELLNTIISNSRDVYVCFLESLKKTRQHHVYQMLTSDEGNVCIGKCWFSIITNTLLRKLSVSKHSWRLHSKLNFHVNLNLSDNVRACIWVHNGKRNEQIHDVLLCYNDDAAAEDQCNNYDDDSNTKNKSIGSNIHVSLAVQFGKGSIITSSAGGPRVYTLRIYMHTRPNKQRKCWGCSQKKSLP